MFGMIPHWQYKVQKVVEVDNVKQAPMARAYCELMIRRTKDKGLKLCIAHLMKKLAWRVYRESVVDPPDIRIHKGNS